MKKRESRNSGQQARFAAGQQSHAAGCTLIDVKTRRKHTTLRLAALAIALVMAQAVFSPPPLPAQSAATTAAPLPHGQADHSAELVPPPSTGGIFALSAVRPGMMATAWTVFTGTRPEPMQVKILGVLRNARGPGQDMILCQLEGAEPQYTGVVEGMSGSPVYIGSKLLGSLSYRIGQFSKTPIAGITPIAQMLPIRNLSMAFETAAAHPIPAPVPGAPGSLALPDFPAADGMNFQAMDTPLVMSGFQPAAVRLWQQDMAGTSLESVVAGGMAGSSEDSTKPSPAAEATLEPGSAISALLVSGDVEISATCTVTYIDPKQLLACGHPVLQAGPVSMPMTTAEVVTTLASPLNSFKIINTGATVGAFTQDRESGIRGVLGAQAHMIPMHIAVDSAQGDRHVNVQVLDLPSLTPQAVEVVLYDALLESNESTAETSYHVTGNIDLAGYPPSPLNFWAPAGVIEGAALDAALLSGQRFTELYDNGARQGVVRQIDLHVQAIPHRIQVQLVSARLVSNDIVHAGDTVIVEATLRPWQQPERNVRIPINLPGRLPPGNLRVLVSGSDTLDRTLNQPQPFHRPTDLQSLLAEAEREHPANRVYVSLLVPEAQAALDGQTLSNLPLSVANALEPMLSVQDIRLNGESVDVAGEAPAGGDLTGFLLLNLHILPGGGLN